MTMIRILLPALLAAVLLAPGCASDSSASDPGPGNWLQKLLPEGRGAVTKRLFSDDPDRRREAIRKLADDEDGRTDEYLKIYALLLGKDSDPGVRAEAASAIGRSANDAYAQELADALNQDESDRVRLAAAVALDRVHGAAAIEPLQLHATRDRSIDVRAASAQALRHYYRHEVIETLVQCLHDDEFTVRYEARQALMHLTGREAGYQPEQWSDLLDGPLPPRQTPTERDRWWNPLDWVS
ncbi:MAG: HEAT repeat domain-containing protein [Planctomycetota bacterium]